MDNRLKRYLLLALCLPVLYGFDPFNTSNANIEKGNVKLKAGKIKEALALYDRAVKDLPDEAGVHYNRGIALHRLGKYKEARDALLKGTMATDPALKAKSFYNLGNAHYKLKRFKDAAAAYKRSLRLSSRHQPSKWNLELALRKIREKKKKEDKKKKKGKKNDKKKKQSKKKKDDPGKKKKQQQQKKKDKSQAKNEPKKKREKKRMNSVLDALDRNDKNLQKKRARIKAGRRRPPEKDW